MVDWLTRWMHDWVYGGLTYKVGAWLSLWWTDLQGGCVTEFMVDWLAWIAPGITTCLCRTEIRSLECLEQVTWWLLPAIAADIPTSNCYDWSITTLQNRPAVYRSPETRVHPLFLPTAQWGLCNALIPKPCDIHTCCLYYSLLSYLGSSISTITATFSICCMTFLNFSY